MSFLKNSILFSKNLHNIIKEKPFTICDVGGRGNIVEPWKSLKEINPKIINIIGFEPDQEECIRLNDTNQGKYYPYALWNSDREISLNIAEEPSTSSIHPPNFPLLKDFPDQQWKPRITKKIVKVTGKTLDGIVNKNNYEFDFMKIDTQGSEFEIIEGSKNTLENNCFGCSLETWTKEVHKGQRLSFDIMKIMHELGFYFFDLQKGASWRRKFADKLLKSKGEVIGLDFLYFKSPQKFFDSKPSVEKVGKAAAISDVWGFPHFSIQLIEIYKERYADSTLDPLKLEILKLRTKDRLNRASEKFRIKVLRDKPAFPNIH